PGSPDGRAPAARYGARAGSAARRRRRGCWRSRRVAHRGRRIERRRAGRNREGDADRGAEADAGRAGEDAAALRLDQAAADRQAEPDPGAPAVADMDAVELVEDELEILGRDAEALVGDLDGELGRLALGADGDRAAGR